MTNSTLNVGDVFLAKNLSLCGENPHYHIVIHKSINNELVVVFTTKETDKTEKRCRKIERLKFDHMDVETMVILNKKHCDVLSLESAINCNYAQIKPESFYLGLPAFKIVSYINDKVILSRIIIGIKKSPLVEQKIINLL